MFYSISKILKRSKKTLLLLFATTVISLFITGCGGLPEGAKQALDERIRLFDSNSYNIASAQKGSNPGGYQEVWCIVTNRPIERMGTSHFVMHRRGLLWEASEWSGTSGRDYFLFSGCSNW